MTISRRQFMALSAAGLTAATLPGLGRADSHKDLDSLTLWGPPVGPSIALAHVAETGASRDLVGDLRFKAWRTPDQLRAGLLSGDMSISGIPSYVGANLFNKGVPVHLMNIMTWGLLYMVSSDGSVSKLEDIAGKTITMPFRNDMPDLVFQYITAKAGLVKGKDFELSYATTPLEVVQMMMTGRADVCILPEPAATASIMRGKKSAVGVRRVLSIQDEWGKATGGKPRIPQAGLLVNAELVEKAPELLRTLQADCVRSSQWVLNNPTDAGFIAEDYMGVKAAIAELAMPFINLDATSAEEAKPELEDFFGRMAELSPAIIGGKLPAADFYLKL